jgi:hypothetical protein
VAVLVEGISVIVRMDRLFDCFKDWELFKDIVPNQTLCADGELARVGFMAPEDAEHFCRILEQWGLHYLSDGQAQDLVVADQFRGLAAPCNWASFGHVNWHGDPKLKVAACMLNGSAHKQLLTPDGWHFDGSLTASYGFVPTGEEPSMLGEATDNNLEVWITPLSNQPYYVGRTAKTTASNAKHNNSLVRKWGWLSRLTGGKYL